MAEYDYIITLRSPVDRQTADELAHWLQRSLKPRQLEVLVLRARGNSAKEVAKILGITPGTVKDHSQAATSELGFPKGQSYLLMSLIAMAGYVPLPKEKLNRQ